VDSEVQRKVPGRLTEFLPIFFFNTDVPLGISTLLREQGGCLSGDGVEAMPPLQLIMKV